MRCLGRGLSKNANVRKAETLRQTKAIPALIYNIEQFELVLIKMVRKVACAPTGAVC